MSSISLINPFNKYLFSTYYVSGTVHSTGATLVNTAVTELLTNQSNSHQVVRNAVRKNGVRGWRLNGRGSFLGKVGQKRPGEEEAFEQRCGQKEETKPCKPRGESGTGNGHSK